MSYFIYILECKDKSLYTGITNDLTHRLTQHQQGTGAKYTRGRSPLTLIYLDTAENRSLASKEEARIKKLTKPQKQALIASASTTLLEQYQGENPLLPPPSPK